MKICNTCTNELIMEFSLATGICSHCREQKYPAHLPDNQWDKYWSMYFEKENSTQNRCKEENQRTQKLYYE